MNSTTTNSTHFNHFEIESNLQTYLCIAVGLASFFLNIIVLHIVRKKSPDLTDPFCGPIQHIAISNVLGHGIMAILALLSKVEFMPTTAGCEGFAWIITFNGQFGKC